ncbi:metal-dependent hydrolase [Corallincola holothuriorum]|uniref:Metal-dependent hydrolase n=1 Tax=Corallincola holothuriorum TaxID=2282215 RepID=A0A368NKS9_9GAMM|nr:metal-dependent hydrolase [Corallincola holothuriorum]RCU50473.1 metal-dependent hydrolase [Corallincola holothuriorum]
MFIAHLPAGYLLAKFFISKAEVKRRLDSTVCSNSGERADKLLSYSSWRRLFFAAALIGAIAPDLDLVWFYLVDNGSVHHHAYWTHYPLFWGAALCLCGLWCRYSSTPFARVLGIFALCGFMHLILDSVAGDIRWLAPMSDMGFSLVTIPANYRVWWFNFLFHWTFLLEVAITAIALGCFLLSRLSAFQAAAERHQQRAHRNALVPLPTEQGGDR